MATNLAARDEQQGEPVSATVPALKTIDRDFGSVRASARARACVRLLTAAAALGILAWGITHWLGWLSAPHTPGKDAWIWQQLEPKTLTVHGLPAKQPPASGADATQSTQAGEVTQAAEEPKASLAQWVLALLVVGTFAWMVWLTRMLLNIARRQLRLFFRELERVERVNIIQLRMRHEGVAALSDLTLSSGDDDEED